MLEGAALDDGAVRIKGRIDMDAVSAFPEEISEVDGLLLLVNLGSENLRRTV